MMSNKGDVVGPRGAIQQRRDVLLRGKGMGSTHDRPIRRPRESPEVRGRRAGFKWLGHTGDLVPVVHTPHLDRLVLPCAR